MALFHVTGLFVADAEARRREIHEAYNEHLAQHRPRVRLAGRLTDAAGARLGVAILLEADDLAQAEAFLQGSPYLQAGLYQSTSVTQLELEVGRLN